MEWGPTCSPRKTRKCQQKSYHRMCFITSDFEIKHILKDCSTTTADIAPPLAMPRPNKSYLLNGPRNNLKRGFPKLNSLQPETNIYLNIMRGPVTKKYSHRRSIRLAQDMQSKGVVPTIPILTFHCIQCTLYCTIYFPILLMA